MTSLSSKAKVVSTYFFDVVSTYRILRFCTQFILFIVINFTGLSKVKIKETKYVCILLINIICSIYILVAFGKQVLC
jgi:hypothetical protein